MSVLEDWNLEPYGLFLSCQWLFEQSSAVDAQDVVACALAKAAGGALW